MEPSEALKKTIYTPIPLNLAFFDEKTEKATPRKKKKSREEGQVAKSQEIGTAFLFIGVFASLRAFAPYMVNRMKGAFYYIFNYMEVSNDIYSINIIPRFLLFLFQEVIITVAPIFIVAMVVGIIINIAQVGWHPTMKPMKPKFSKLSPLKGLKRLFSVKLLIDLIKAVLKFSVILAAIYMVLQKEKNMILSFLDMDLIDIVGYIGDLSATMGITVGVLYVFIAGLDYAYQRFKHEKQLKMSKQEIKEEFKQTEGNPQIKGRMRQKMREMSMRRMMQQVPEADVIITNPTHYAVALKYDREKSQAPILLAKGVDHMAQKIKEVAKENSVVIVENKPLARTIYATVEINREIPPELYQTVAEILAYVYKLKNIA